MVKLFAVTLSAKSENDTIIKDVDINLAYSTIDNPPIVVDSGDTIILYSTSKASLTVENPDWKHNLPLQC